MKSLRRASTRQIHEQRRRLAPLSVVLAAVLLANPLKVGVGVVMLLLLDHERLGALLPKDLGVLPKLVLLPLGDPSLDQNIIGVLRRRDMSVSACS